MHPYETDNCYIFDKATKNSDDQVVVRKLLKRKINNNNFTLYHEYASTDDDCPFGPLFKLFRSSGLSFLGRESLDDSRITKKWLLAFEISSLLMSNLSTMYWIIKLLIELDYKSMDQSTIGQIVLPAFLFNLVLISCLCRFLVNYAFDQIYKIQLFVFELVDNKESVFRKLRKVVKNISIIYSLFLSLSLVYASINLFVTRMNSLNLSYFNLAVKFILYFCHAFTGKNNLFI